MKHLVFSFGSNLDPCQMTRRCPSADFHARGELRGFRLRFAGFSARWGGAVATLEPSRRARTHGILYSVTSEDLEVLDRCEGHPCVYRRQSCKPITQNGTVFVCHTYLLVRDVQFTDSLSPAYVETIRRGYEVWGLPYQALYAAARRAA